MARGEKRAPGAAYTVSFRPMKPPERRYPKADAKVPIVRLSVGLEDPDDLIADLERGLIATRRIGKPTRTKHK